MLSSALRIGHRPTNTKKTREKRVEAQASNQSPAPMQPVVQAEPRPIVWKQVALATAAVGAHLLSLGELIEPYVNYAIYNFSSGSSILEWLGSAALPNAGLLLSLLLSGALFFKRQQRVPMLLNALVWLTLLSVFANPSDRASWPCLLAALASLAAAFAINKRSSNDSATPIE